MAEVQLFVWKYAFNLVSLLYGGARVKKVIFGQLGRLKPEKIQDYEMLHGNPWPEVLQTIRDCNLQNYSIFRHEDLVFAYFEYVGENYEEDMQKMEQDPITLEWWKHTKPCFIQYSIRPDSQFYADMKQIFYFE